MRLRRHHGQHASPATYTQVQLAQAHAGSQYGFPHVSIEAATSPAAFSSPCGMYKDHVPDTSSESSASRASSTCPRGSISSSAAIKGRSTHTKRGSESQGSGTDRSNKRPDSSKAALWCLECKCDITNCPEPSVHKAKVKKIVKEKSSRSSQACILQNHEDLMQTLLNISGFKAQQPGNKKKSGILWDKKEVLAASEIFLETAVRNAASLGVLNDIIKEARSLVEDHIAHGPSEGLPAGSLMSGPDGEGPCLHELNHVKCETSIECRKSRRGVHLGNNLKNIMSSAGYSAFRQPLAGSRSNSSDL